MTRILSNGGSGGSTGSSAGLMMSIPWCSGVEWNLGHCFGNQGGSQSAEREREVETQSLNHTRLLISKHSNGDSGGVQNIVFLRLHPDIALMSATSFQIQLSAAN